MTHLEQNKNGEKGQFYLGLLSVCRGRVCGARSSFVIAWPCVRLLLVLLLVFTNDLGSVLSETCDSCVNLDTDTGVCIPTDTSRK